MYQEQQNTLYPKGGRFCEHNLLKLMIGSQPIMEGTSLFYGRRGLHSINLVRWHKKYPLGVKGILLLLVPTIIFKFYSLMTVEDHKIPKWVQIRIACLCRYRLITFCVNYTSSYHYLDLILCRTGRWEPRARTLEQGRLHVAGGAFCMHIMSLTAIDQVSSWHSKSLKCPNQASGLPMPALSIRYSLYPAYLVISSLLFLLFIVFFFSCFSSPIGH